MIQCMNFIVTSCFKQLSILATFLLSGDDDAFLKFHSKLTLLIYLLLPYLSVIQFSSPNCICFFPALWEWWWPFEISLTEELHQCTFVRLIWNVFRFLKVGHEKKQKIRAMVNASSKLHQHTNAKYSSIE